MKLFTFKRKIKHSETNIYDVIKPVIKQKRKTDDDGKASIRYYYEDCHSNKHPVWN